MHGVTFFLHFYPEVSESEWATGMEINFGSFQLVSYLISKLSKLARLNHVHIM